uniref:Uncharacterized protein n=1 Tax=Lotus japonicus TaxID=34305 RepID=I3SUQ7_LOTJA|nr:unknown [Lotus japonicus]
MQFSRFGDWLFPSLMYFVGNWQIYALCLIIL